MKIVPWTIISKSLNGDVKYGTKMVRNLGRRARVSDQSNYKKKVGRPKRLDSESVAELRKLSLSKPYSVRELAEMFDVSRMTVWKAVNG